MSETAITRARPETREHSTKKPSSVSGLAGRGGQR